MTGAFQSEPPENFVRRRNQCERITTRRPLTRESEIKRTCRDGDDKRSPKRGKDEGGKKTGKTRKGKQARKAEEDDDDDAVYVTRVIPVATKTAHTL